MAKRTDNTSTAVVPFLFEGDGLVRVVPRKGEPWFVATDLARTLGFRDASNAVRYLDEDEKDTLNQSTPGGVQEHLIVSESGLYALILRSRKPAAHRFRRWVTGDVLPSIRKTGSYRAPPRRGLTEEERAARADLAARRTRVNELNTATRTLHEIRMTQGPSAAAAAAPGLYAPFGINLEAVEPPQGELPLADDSGGSMH